MEGTTHILRAAITVDLRINQLVYWISTATNFCFYRGSIKIWEWSRSSIVIYMKGMSSLLILQNGDGASCMRIYLKEIVLQHSWGLTKPTLLTYSPHGKTHLRACFRPIDERMLDHSLRGGIG